MGKILNDMIGESWNPTPRPEERQPATRGVYVTLERQIKCALTTHRIH